MKQTLVNKKGTGQKGFKHICTKKIEIIYNNNINNNNNQETLEIPGNTGLMPSGGVVSSHGERDPL